MVGGSDEIEIAGGGSDVITSTVLGIRIECKITDVI
jgi:hypothetical protein